jgi:hypothetical protein
VSEVVIVLDGERPLSWNGMYAGKHFSKRSKMANLAHMLVRRAIPDGFIPFSKVVDIHITAEMKHPVMDSDNVVAKVMIDGLKPDKDDSHQPFVIRDDDPRWVRRVTTEAVKAKDNRVTIRVTEVEQ